jgi:glycosyltransferase involved in cell wall biosynthesis
MKVAMLIPDNRDEFGRYEELDPVFGPAPAALIEGLAGRPEIELHILSCAKRSMRAPEKLAENIWFHLLHVGQWGWLRTLYSGCVRSIRGKLREIHPDVVHGQGTERYCALAAARSGYPSVITIHGNMRTIAKVNRAPILSYGWCAARLEQFTVPRVGGVICVSTHTQALTENAARRTWLVPNAVGSAFFKNRTAPPIETTILCVGTISRLKNQIALIRALDPLAAKNNFQLVFLGTGDSADPYFIEFQQLVRSRPWCKHEGFVESVRLQDFLGRASILALPTLEDNCPMVILEAAASGVPVMASAVGGIPDLIRDGQTGILFDPHDWGSIQSATERYLFDPDFAEKMAANAKANAEIVFRPKKVAAQHLAAYQELLKS